MPYPINSHENRTNIAFQQRAKSMMRLKPTGNAVLNYHLFSKVNSLKTLYIDLINKVKNNTIIVSKIASQISNVKIADEIITINKDDNKSIKLSLFEVGKSKLFRIKFLENKKQTQLITLDDFRLVKSINENEITYFNEEAIDKNEISSIIENLYSLLYTPFLELNKQLLTMDLSKLDGVSSIQPKFKIQVKAKEIFPGISANMLPTSKPPFLKEKPLFSYAALIDSKPIINGIVDDNISNVLIIPKHGGNFLKQSKNEVLEQVQSKPFKKGEDSLIGRMPKAFSKKIVQIKNLYYEINNSLKDLSSSSIEHLKQIFNIEKINNNEFYFNEPNGDIFSIIKLETKDSNKLQIFKMKFNNSDSLEDIEIVVCNAKNLISNINNLNQKIDNTNLLFKTQNELNSIIYQASFQSLVKKITDKLIEIKKALDIEIWKTKQRHRLRVEPLKIQPETQNSIIKFDNSGNFILDEYLLTRIKKLWQDLIKTEELALSKNIQKKDIDFIITKAGFTGFYFKDKNKIFLIDKIFNKHGLQYRISVKKNTEALDTYIITEEGFVVKNVKNGNVPATKTLQFISKTDEVDKITQRINNWYNKLKHFSKMYQKDIENKIKQLSAEEKEIKSNNNQATLSSIENDNKNFNNKSLGEEQKSTLINKMNNVVKNIKEKFKWILKKSKNDN